MRLNFLDKPDTNDKLQGKTMNGKQLYETRSSANGEGPIIVLYAKWQHKTLNMHSTNTHTHAHTHAHRHTHTHTRLTALFPGLPG